MTEVIDCIGLKPIQFSVNWANRNEPRMLCTSVTIRRAGNLIELSQDGTIPLQKPVRDLIEPNLTYTYQQYLVGADRIDPITGYQRGPFRFEECRLYRYDAKGRLCCGVGFLPRIKQLITGSGCTYRLINCDSPHPRSNRYEEDWNSVTRNFSFRPTQDECLVAIAANEYGVIKAPTGFGKGEIIAMVCCLYPNAKVHIVTPSRDLVEKTVATLTKYIPMVGQVGCGKKRINRVTVFSADSLHLSDGDVDIVLGDEIHKLAAPTYSDALAKYRHSRNYGFSATPTGRADGADAKLESLFGPVIFELTYQQATANGLVVPITVDWLHVHMDINPSAGKKDVPKKRWGIWRNDYRNQIIANKALSYDADDQVLILVETIEHLLYLRKLLPGFKACYSENGMKPEDVDFYRRKGLMEDDEMPITAKERAQLRKDYELGNIKKAIATGVWATGVDFEQLAVLIRADALGSDIADVQAPGRVSRISSKSDKPYGVVVDFLDQFDEGFRRKAVGRRRSYESNGWIQNIPPRQSI